MLFVLAALVCLFSASASAETLPAESNVLNVRTMYGARGDGIADDTAAFRAAISDCILRSQTLYVPNGTYRVTDSLLWRRVVDQKFGGRCSVEGESREGTIVRLADNAPGFGDPTKPKPVFSTSSTALNNPQPLTKSGGVPGGNEAFVNSFYDLTIDTGSNRGAIGLDWVCSNRGSIREVTIRGNGAIGLDSFRIYPGPCLIERVEVDGFDTGIRIEQEQFSLTLVDVTLRNQAVLGILMGALGVHVENLVSENRVPALKMRTSNSSLTLVGLRASGGDPTRAALELEQLGRFLLRDIETSGYRGAVKRGPTFSGASIAEMPSDAPQTLFGGGPLTTLGLPIEQAPEAYRSDSPAAWCRPAGPTSISTDAVDDWAAIQAALNRPECPIVYLPHSVRGQVVSQYVFSRTLDVPAHVRRIIIFDNFLIPSPAFPPGAPAFRVAEDSALPVTIERLWGTGASLKGGVWLEHSSNRTVHVRNSQLAGSNRGILTLAGAGKLFLSDVFAQVELTGTKLWARQLNTELPTLANVNNGGDFWVLGAKTETDFTYAATRGGRSEILGGFFMPGVGTGSTLPDQPAFTVTDGGQLSASYQTWGQGSAADTFQVHARETLGIETRELLAEDVVQVRNSVSLRSWVPLLVLR